MIAALAWCMPCRCCSLCLAQNCRLERVLGVMKGLTNRRRIEGGREGVCSREGLCGRVQRIGRVCSEGEGSTEGLTNRGE